MPMVEIWEAWGKFPLSIMTGNDEDDTKYIDAHVVVSNLSNSPKVHLIEKMKSVKKPYEEAWYKRVNGRWYGRGAAEMCLMLQTWMNAIVNIRINRSYVAQLGLFKIRRGS